MHGVTPPTPLKYFHQKPGGNQEIIILMELQAMHTISTDYGPLCIIPSDSLNASYWITYMIKIIVSHFLKHK